MIEDQTLAGINSELFKLEQELQDSSDTVAAAHEEYLAAKSALALARARALMKAEGKTAAEREAWVTIQCEAESVRVDVASAAFDYAKGRARDLRDTLSALQTRSANIRKEIDLAR